MIILFFLFFPDFIYAVLIIGIIRRKLYLKQKCGTGYEVIYDQSLMRPQMQSSLCFWQLRLKVKDPSYPHKDDPRPGNHLQYDSPGMSLKPSSYQQETGRVLLEKTGFTLDENKSQSLPKQMAPEL